MDTSRYIYILSNFHIYLLGIWHVFTVHTSSVRRYNFMDRGVIK